MTHGRDHQRRRNDVAIKGPRHHRRIEHRGGHSSATLEGRAQRKEGVGYYIGNRARNIEVDLAVAAVVRLAEEAAHEEHEAANADQLKEIEELTAARDASQERGATLDAEMERLKRGRDQLQGQVGQMQRDFDAIRTQRAQAEEQFNEVRQSLGQSKERVRGLEARLDELMASESAAKSELAALRQREEAAATGQAEVDRKLAITVAELEARYAVEHKARGDVWTGRRRLQNLVLKSLESPTRTSLERSSQA